MAHFIFECLVRATALFAVAFLACRLLRGASAAQRAGVWRAAFVGVALLPLASLALPPLALLPAAGGGAAGVRSSGAVDLASSPTAPAPLDAAALARASAATRAASTHQERAGDAPGGAPPAAPRPAAMGSLARLREAFGRNASTLFIALWSLGAVGALGALARGLARAARIVRAAEPQGSDAPSGARVLTSAAPEAPFVWDLRPFARPALVLASASSAAEFERAVLLHERQHLARRDGLALVLARAVAALAWPTPLAWLALRRLRLETERACDDAVLSGGVRASDFAAGLVARSTAPAYALAVPTLSSPGGLSERIEAMLAARADRRALGAHGRVALALCGAAIVAPVAALQRAPTATAAALTAAASPATTQAALPAQPSPKAADARQEPAADPAPAPAAAAQPVTTPDRMLLWSRGLAALVAMQDPATGAWRGDVGFKLNNDWRVTSADVPDVGVTGLAVEALARAGQRYGDGPYGIALMRGALYLTGTQNVDGYFTSLGTRLRSHAHALVGLSSIQATLPVADHDEALRRALEFSVSARSSRSEGWRFDPFAEDSDILETAHQVHAYRVRRRELESARLREVARRQQLDPRVGFQSFAPIPDPFGDAIDTYVASLRSRVSESALLGSYRYQSSESSRVTANTTAAGLLVLATSDDAVPDERWQETLAAYRSLRAQRDITTEPWASHFLTWDAQLLAARAMAAIGRQGSPAAKAAAAEFQAEIVTWLAALEQPGGGWCCTVGPGDAYFTAIACVLLAQP